MQEGKGMKINILGTEYTIEERSIEEDALLCDMDGYCDKSVKLIVISKPSPEANLEDLEWYRKKIMRHEIIHAFLFESGIHGCYQSAQQYGHDETMVDWLAVQFPKILEVFKEAGCL